MPGTRSAGLSSHCGFDADRGFGGRHSRQKAGPADHTGWQIVCRMSEVHLFGRSDNLCTPPRFSRDRRASIARPLNLAGEGTCNCSVLRRDSACCRPFGQKGVIGMILATRCACGRAADPHRVPTVRRDARRRSGGTAPSRRVTNPYLGTRCHGAAHARKWRKAPFCSTDLVARPATRSAPRSPPRRARAVPLPAPGNRPCRPPRSPARGTPRTTGRNPG
jgi:hypothetical protein